MDSDNFFDPSTPTYDPEQLAMLKLCSEAEDMSKWNDWRDKNTGATINLCGADLKCARLTSANLNNALMIKTHLEGAFMPYAKLINARLTGAFLQGVDLGHATLDGADLNGANLGKASLDMQKNPNNSNRYFDDDIEEEKPTCLRNASLKGAIFANANLEGADLIGVNLGNSSLDKKTNMHNANLEGADLSFAIFENADLGQANLKDAKLLNTNLKNANLPNADLTDANLWEVNLEGADLRYAILGGTSISGDKVNTNLKGTDFTGASVNGKTLIICCDIDEKTNFSAVNIDSARVEPKLLTTLKTNVRRISWNEYYTKNGKSLWGKIKTVPIRYFWLLSDYGSSSTRIGLSILIAILFFTDIYLALGKFVPGIFTIFGPNTVLLIGIPVHDYIRVLCFAISTMVTLGFGGINITVVPEHIWLSSIAFLCVTLNLVSGFLFLSVLVTRFGILFQSQAPEQEAKKTNNTRLYFIALILFTSSFYFLNGGKDIIDFLNYAALVIILYGMPYYRFK